MPEPDAPIHLVDYDSQWTRLFEAERAALHPILLPWLAGPIEHIGSTAVPGLSAKPVIDIMAAVKTLEESKEAITAVESLGYLYAPYRPDIMHWFCKPDRSLLTHHLHLVPYQIPLWTARILFRDRLREAPEIAAEYLALKQTLAASFKTDREAYTDGKTGFVNRIISEAIKKQDKQPGSCSLHLPA